MINAINPVSDKMTKLIETIQKFLKTFETDQSVIDYVHKVGLLERKESANFKIAKSNKLSDYRTANLPLLPASLSGQNVCPNHADCINDCIGVFSGQNIMPNAVRSKLGKTLFWNNHKDEFIEIIMRELSLFEKLCRKQKRKPAVRLNTYSDIVWEIKAPIIFEYFPSIQFYDYSKVYQRRKNTLPANYDITYSAIASRHNNAFKLSQLARDCRISLVVSGQIFDDHFARLGQGEYITVNGTNYYNGDLTDLTFRYPTTRTALVLKEKTKYRIDPNNLNPLVYRSAEDLGL